jgi:hypothetical protein
VELVAQDKLNSEISGYCQMACWAVYHSPEMLVHKLPQGEEITTKYMSCDHVRVITPGTHGKGKDGDWFCHTVMLIYLITFYTRTLGIKIRRVKLWTDGAPGQYKCRQTFGSEAVLLRKLFPDIEVHQCLIITKHLSFSDLSLFTVYT